MFSILPININFRQATKSIVNRPENITSTKSIQPQSLVPQGEDVTNKFSQKEIKNILKKAGTYQETKSKLEHYTVTYYSDTDRFVINDTLRTNNTTSVDESGIIYHRGSWHIDKADIDIMQGKAIYNHMKSKIRGNI